MTMPNPMVRSMRPAIIGSMAPSDSNAMMPLSLKIDRTLIAVGKESGSRIEKVTASMSVKIGKP
jgi:hypothetical protein